MRKDRAGRVRRDILALSHSGLDWATLALKAGSVLRSAVPFEQACWHSMDPATGMVTGAVKERLADDPRHVRYEFSVEDVNKFAFLARSRFPVGILSQATYGYPPQSPRFRELLQPLGIGWELRAAFVADGDPWGACGIYRYPDQPDFSAQDAAFVADISRILAEGFRRAMLVAGTAIEATPDGPGLVLLDDRDATISITPAAVRWLADLIDIGQPVNRSLPAPVYAIAARARGLHASGGAVGMQARARAFTRSGQWLLLHGSQLDGSAKGLTAVIVEPARPADVTSLVVRAYGLSEREQHVTDLVLRGLATKEIARELDLSPLTIQHYLKMIFEKVGVRSRGELTARILYKDRSSTQLLPPISRN